MSGKKSTHVSEAKKKIVKDLIGLIKSKKTILLASIKNLPAAQFQEVCKKLRGKAIIKVPRKNLMFLALDNSGIEHTKELEQYIGDSTAILFSDNDAFDLAGDLLRNKNPAKAKAGQEAPEDIKVQPGPTDLVPGPAISELGAVGIPIEIKEGKIYIKSEKIIARKGEKISQNAADVMSKLDIRPFSVGFIPLSALDLKEGKMYKEIKIDREATLKLLKEAYSRSLPFAVSIGHTSKDTIGFLLAKAESHAKTLEKLKPVVDVKVEAEEGNKELIAEEPTEEVKAPKGVPSAEGKETQTPSENKTSEEGK